MTFRVAVDNSVVANGFVHNGLRFNGLRFNGLRFNGLRFNSSDLGGTSVTDIEYDPTVGGIKALDGSTTETLDVGETLVVTGDESDGTVFEMEVSGVEQITNSAQDYQFLAIRTRVQTSADPVTWDAWDDACLDGAGNPVKAILLPGDWSSTDYSFISGSDTGGETTFACRGAALAKCVEWGYHPQGTESSTALADYHEACTRMVRADYCGNGDHHTENGTSIDIEDALSINVHDSETAQDIEAAWGVDGALCLNNPRKTYWTKTGIDTECGSALPSCDQNSNGDLKDDEAYWYGQGALLITRNTPAALNVEPPAPPEG